MTQEPYAKKKILRTFNKKICNFSGSKIKLPILRLVLRIHMFSYSIQIRSSVTKSRIPSTCSSCASLRRQTNVSLPSLPALAFINVFSLPLSHFEAAKVSRILLLGFGLSSQKAHSCQGSTMFYV